LGSFDCILAASCIRRSATLVSADRGFTVVPGLDHLDPATPEFTALLA
jgi:predicted nucleic acid-binding protein